MAIAVCLLGLADMARAQDQPRWAVKLLGAIDGMLKAAGAVLEPADRLEYDRNIASTHEALGEDRFTEAWAEGQAMTVAQAMESATG